MTIEAKDPRKVAAGRLGGLKKAALHAGDRSVTQAARNAQRVGFETVHRCVLCGTVEIDPERKLPPDERARRGEKALRLHLALMRHARWRR